MDTNAQRELHDAFWRSSGGFDLVLGPILLSLVGLFLDRRFGTPPWFMIGLLVFGAIGAAMKVYYDWKRGMAAAEIERDRLRADAASLREELARAEAVRAEAVRAEVSR